jgi:hypothetical protein
MYWSRINFVALVLVSVFSGCAAESNKGKTSSPSPQFDPLLVTTERPSDTIPVAVARKNAQDQETIAMVGRIGGSANPFVDGLAAFTLIDPGLPDCAGDEECSDGSCCTPEELKANSATVKFLNSSGKPIPVDARKLLNVDAKAMVAVHGKVQRDDVGNLTLLADKLYLYRE